MQTTKYLSAILIISFIFGCAARLTIVEKRALPADYIKMSQKNDNDIVYCLVEKLQSAPKAGMAELAATGYSIGSFKYAVVAKKSTGETRITGIIDIDIVTDILVIGHAQETKIEYRNLGQRKHRDATISIINECSN